MEEKLINDLIIRLANELPIVKGKFNFREDVIVKENEKALIDFSVYKLGFIVNGIALQLDRLIKMQTANSEELTKLCASQLYFLNLLCLCLTKQWDHIRAELKNFESQNESEKIRIKEIEETILPPPLEDKLAKDLLRILVHFVTKTHPFFHNELTDKAAKGLYQLSASNFETIISSISQYMAPNCPASEEEIISQIHLLELLNFNSKNLSDLLMKMGKYISSVKKAGIQICCARVVRKAIWNWIDKYPMEFVKLQSNSRGPMGGQPDVLFDVFDNWGSSKKEKRGYFWPTCTMLLILCPDILLRIVQNTVPKDEVGKEKFIEGLKKALKQSKTSDVAAICYVDICKASIYVSKSDLSGLRHMVPEIETELKERLFNPNAPFKNADGVVDENLMVDYLLSMYYLNSRKVINSIFIDCAKPGSSIIFRRVFVRVLLRIARESTNLPWNPTLSDIYPVHAGTLRSLVQEFVVMLREYPSLLGSSDKKSKAQVEKILNEIDVLEKLIILYKEDPVLALFPQKTSVQDMEDIKALLTGLCDCVANYQYFPAISDQAIGALLALHKPENIEKWCTKSGVDGFWIISSTVNSMLTSIVIEQPDLDQVFIEKLVSLLEKILTDRNRYLENVKDSKPSASSKAVRYQASTKLESALLILLINGNSEVISRVANCFGLLCAEVDILRSWISDTDNTIAVNYDSYKQLAATGGLSTGRQAQQKAVRNMLKRVERYTVGNFIGWEEISSRWAMYTIALLRNEELAAAEASKKSESKPSKKEVSKKNPKGSGAGDLQIPRTILEKSSADVLFEWNNALGLLCSLAAVSVNQEKQIKVQASGKGAPKGGKEETINVLENFINELMELLVSEFVNVREAVKMMVGSSLSGGAYSTLFKILHTQAKNIFGKAGQVNFSNDSMLFVDQAISIMKLILENPSGNDDLTLLTDFEDLIMTLLRFVRQLTISISSLQTRHKLCSLIESLMKKSALLTFKAEYQFRTDLIENIMEWTSEFSTKESNIPQDLAANAARQIGKLIKELDVQVMQSISCLLNNLPLQGKDDEAKSNAFSKYFTFFTNLLTRCKRNPQSVLTPQLPEATIQSLSFLVTANLEHGLDYFVTMGYHEDFETRSAFLKVLTNILKEGTEFDNAGEVPGEKYYKLSEMIFEPSLEVILTLCDVTNIADADHVAQLLVRIFESNDKTMELLKGSIKQEVAKTESANTLFRLNSMATKLLAAFCKMIGTQYLKIALGPQLRALQNVLIPLELNDPKLSEAELNINRKNVQTVCEKFLVDIRASIPQCPAPLREICRYLKQVVSEKFPGSEHTAIAGFIFLRFLCPAIVAPDGYGVISQDIQDKDLRRGLVLVTKVLQNLANRVLFTKEKFMECMNPFIDANLSLIRDMFEMFASEPENPAPLPAISFSEEQKLEDMGRLHYFLSISMEKLAKIWSTQKGNTLSNRLNNIISQLGTPPEPGAKARENINSVVGGGNIATSQGQNVHYEKFMARMANKDTEVIRQREIFYQQGKTKKGVPVFYYLARNYRSDIDLELLNYHLLKTAQPFISKPFVIVIDLTLFSNDNQWTLPMCSSLAKLIPDPVLQNLEAVYFLNPNTWFKKYSKRISKVVYRVQKKFHFVPNLAKLCEIISENELGLPAYSTSLDRNVQSTFSPVTKLGQYNKRQDVTLKISTDLLQIISKDYSIFNHMTPLNDIIKISQVIDLESNPNKEEFTLKYDQNGVKTLYFVCASSDQIVQQLTASKDRYKLSQPQNSLARSKAFRPSDVPGTLMNMALLNLLSSNHTLRVSSYNLLVTLLASFSFSTRSLLVESYDIAIPKSCKHFVKRISSELASSVPSLTLDFLLEAIQGFSKSEKLSQVLVLDYIKPWLYNLREYTSSQPISLIRSPHANIVSQQPVQIDQEKFNKAKDIINSLIALSIREYNDIGPVIVNKCWKTLGRVPEAFDLLVSCLFDRAASNKGASPLGSKDMDCYEEIMVAMATQNPSLISGKLLSLFINLLKETHDPNNSIERIELHSYWIRIEVLLRWLLALSNENLIVVNDYLSEILFIVILTFFSGDVLIRSNVYTLYLNTVHSILVSQFCPPEKLATLRLHFSELQQGQSKFYFGIGGKNLNVSPYQKTNRDEKFEKLQIPMVENLTHSIFTILNCCSPQDIAIGTLYHTKLLEYCFSVAFTTNLFLQPRAIAALGVLCPSSALVTDQLIGNLLTVLKSSLAASSSGKKYHEDISISIVTCFAKLYEHLDSKSKYFKPLMWLALALIQIHEVPLFMVSVQFLESIIKTMFDRGFFKGQGLAGFCMEARKGQFKGSLDKLDQLTGFNFTGHFSFALAGHLLKGMKNPNTKAATTKLLSTIINNSRESNHANLLGYLCALLPSISDDIAYLRPLLPSETEDRNISVFHPLLIPDKYHGALFFAMYATVLKNSDSEHEQIYIYRSFEEGIQFMPESFPVTYDVLIPKMEQILVSSQNETIISHVLAIMNSMSYYGLESGSVVNFLNKTVLQQTGFSGIPDSDLFQNKNKANLVQAVCAVLDCF